MPYQARFPLGAFSVESKIAPPHSPPNPNPCPNRNNARSIGAMMPIAAYEGRQPINTVDKPIVKSEATSVTFRPMRSPKCPNKAEPNGRAIKAKPNVASDCSIAMLALDEEKKILGKTSTAAVPKI